MTNFERIKQMTVEEIVEFIVNVALERNVNWLKGDIQKWLESEVEE